MAVTQDHGRQEVELHELLPRAALLGDATKMNDRFAALPACLGHLPLARLQCLDFAFCRNSRNPMSSVRLFSVLPFAAIFAKGCFKEAALQRPAW